MAQTFITRFEEVSMHTHTHTHACTHASTHAHTQYLGLQDALPEVWDHEEELQGRGHVAGGTQILDPTVACLTAPVVLRPVLKGVGLVRL